MNVPSLVYQPNKKLPGTYSVYDLFNPYLLFSSFISVSVSFNLVVSHFRTNHFNEVINAFVKSVNRCVP